MKKENNILKQAEEIIFQRAEEKERDYGPINESFVETAKIASILTGKHLSTEDCYKVMIALKMSRMKRGYKRDTYLDAIGYMGALAEYLEDMKPKDTFKMDYNEEASE